jgi:hypothetical protein
VVKQANKYYQLLKMADFDVIDEVIVESNEDDRFLELGGNYMTTDPVIIRGNGNFTLYVDFNNFCFDT